MILFTVILRDTCVSIIPHFLTLCENVKREKNKHKSEIQKWYILDVCHTNVDLIFAPLQNLEYWVQSSDMFLLFQQNAFCLHMINYRGGFSSCIYPQHPTTVSVRFFWGNIPSKDEKFAHMMLFLWNFSYVFQITSDKSLGCQSMKKLWYLKWWIVCYCLQKWCLLDFLYLLCRCDFVHVQFEGNYTTN